MNHYIPVSYAPYYNGWNRINSASPSGVSIHHPDGDIKKISTYTSALVSVTWFGPPDAHWRVTWTTTTNGLGVTEPGSSGSPIFDNNGRIVGTLSGGMSACDVGGAGPGTGPDKPDYYGKFSYHWLSNGASSSQRLKPWLDPDNTVTTLDGINQICGDIHATANATTVLVGGNVDFTDLSTGFPTYWRWDFEGGSPAATIGQEPSLVVYNTVGTYDVRLIVKNLSGINDTLIKTNYITVVDSLPAAGFDANNTTVAVGNSVTYYNHSIGSPISWNWTFEGGTPSSSTVQYPPGIIYNSIGNYAVTLIVSDGIDYDTLTKIDYITVVDTVSVEFSVSTTNVFVGESVDFTDFSTGNPTSWNWTFNGGTPSFSINQNPDSIVYNTIGTYTVELTISNGYDVDTETKINYITVFDTVSAEFSTDTNNVIVGDSVNFTDLSTGNPTFWNWTFDGGTPSSSTDQNPVNIIYDTDGIYTVELTISNGFDDDTETKLDYIIVTSSGIYEIENSGINIYPNPSDNYVFVDLGSFIIKDVEIKIYNILGKLVDLKGGHKIYNNTIKLDFTSIPDGLYLIKINSHKVNIIKKVSIAR